MRPAAVALAMLTLSPVAIAQEEPAWFPPAGATFQIQLQGEIDTSYEADVYEIDGFDVGTDLVDELHGLGRKVVCYMNAGAWENWRPDKGDFPKKVLGKKLEGWPGERWLDIRAIETLRPIMAARVDVCAEKGFDGVDFDNINGYSNDTGFPLKKKHQVRYDRMLAEVAHERGMAIGLKNVPELVSQLEPHYDFVVNESCFTYKECDPYEAFIANGKAVFVIEYELPLEKFCDKAEAKGFSAQRKKLNLKAWRKACWEN